MTRPPQQQPQEQQQEEGESPAAAAAAAASTTARCTAPSRTTTAAAANRSTAAAAAAHHHRHAPPEHHYYRNNASAVYPLAVSTQNPRQQRRDAARVAAALCPWLLWPPPPDSTPNKNAANSGKDDDDEELYRPSLSTSPSRSCGGGGLEEDSSAPQEEEAEETFKAAVERLTVRPLLGGLSNALYIVESNHNSSNNTATSGSSSSGGGPYHHHPAVLVRIHPAATGGKESASGGSGSGSDGGDLVDRAVENRLVAWLARQPIPLAPTVYGRFLNGRVEEFYRAVRPLNYGEMPAHAAQIGRRLAQLHQLRPPAAVWGGTAAATARETKENDDDGDDDADGTRQQRHPQQQLLPGSIWKRSEDWCAMARQKLATNNNSRNGAGLNAAASSKEMMIAQLLQEWQTAWEWTRQAFRRHYRESNHSSNNNNNHNTAAAAATAFAREIVLAHMDCQSLNLLIPDGKDGGDGGGENDDSAQLRVIDYEYAGLNPRAADLANTLLEFCPMNEIAVADWDREYPADSVQDELLRGYLAELKDDDPHWRKPGGEDHDAAFRADLRREIGRYTLISHLSWSVWALVLALNNNSSNGNNNADSSTSSVVHVGGGGGGGGVAPMTNTPPLNGNRDRDPAEEDFDYVAYARQRLDGYRHFRARFWDA